MSIQSNFPAIKPTLLLDFANVEQLDPRITFARTSTATYYGTQTAKAEENLLLQSQDFTTTWTTTSLTVTSNSSTAPDGTTTAETYTDDATADRHTVSQAISTQLNTNFVFSCFLKAGTGNFAALSLTNSSTASRFATVVVDLSTGTISDTSNSATTTATSSITLIGSGWYRVVLSASQSSVAFGAARICVSNSGTPSYTTFGQPTYSGSGSTIEVWGAQLEQRSAVTAYTPTTTQPITNYIPVLQTAASGVARFDHNPTTFESLGLLIEEQRTNLVTYSEMFADASWTKARSTITANTVVAPDGALTADTFADNDVSLSHIIRTATITSAPTTSAVTATIYAKQNNQSNLFILYVTGDLDSSTYGRVASTFNLSTGTVEGNSSVNGATFTSNSITPVGNGWYRCSVTGTVGSTASPTGVRFVAGFATIANASVASSYAGTGQSIFIWGAQLEAGAFATSYIPTVASQVTRSSDSASMMGTNFSSWYNQAQGTVFSDVVLRNTPASVSCALYYISNGTTNERIAALTGSGGGGNINTVVSVGGVLQAQTINTSLSTAGNYKYANVYQVNNFVSVANGGSAAVDTSGTLPIVDRLFLGASQTGLSLQINGTIKKFAYYPLAATSAQLQGLTS
jgi:hypothetical protein